MKFCFRELLWALSYLLDCVEHELLGVTNEHARRVAYLCTCMGSEEGLPDEALSDLAACALLHDNALTEYIQSEWNYVLPEEIKVEGKAVGLHCSMGERNCKEFPFHTDVRGAIRYHHEHADGSGPFRRTAEETPLFARLIHIADQVDTHFHLDELPVGRRGEVLEFVDRMTGKWFDSRTAALFRKTFRTEVLEAFAGRQVGRLALGQLPFRQEEFQPEQVRAIASVFARIIDYKSSFTSSHSMGIAEKCGRMARFYGWDEEKCAAYYLAGALHDIGKAAVDNAILEKPGKLTAEEFEEMKRHASITWEVLSRVGGMEEIASWAALHHERLNGQGYPFGYGAERLGFEERLMACVDVYQALSEQRPYKDGMEHGVIMGILRQMASDNWLDSSCVEDIDTVFGEPGLVDQVVGEGREGKRLAGRAYR